MAAPTEVRVEATSITTTVLRWAGGVGNIGVYRSTDGVVYAIVESETSSLYTVVAGTFTYTDVGLLTSTKYWYKLTDDAGATFSSVVTVWTHLCASPAGGPDTLALPRMTPGGDARTEGEIFNEAVETLEVTLGDRILLPRQCEICPDDGRLVIDCSSGCHEFVVDVTEDINSISLNWCEGGGTIDFVIPPNVTRRICGWPAGMGFTGDECTQAPLSGGPSGTTQGAYVDKLRIDPKSRTGYGGGGSGSGGDCTCVPGPKNELTIKSCNPNNRLCIGPTPRLMLKVCGGKPPYTWTHTGNVKFQGDIADRTTDKDTVVNPVANRTPSVVVLPPVNSGSQVAGTAYTKNLCFWANAACTSCNSFVFAGGPGQGYGCRDQFTDPVDGLCGSTATVYTCDTAACTAGPRGCAQACDTNCLTGDPCTNIKNSGVVLDVRTAPMIAAGCNPCAFNAGATVSVTDGVGTVATIILKA